MRDVALFALGSVGGLVIGTWLNSLGRAIVRFVLGWVLYVGFIVAVGRLPLAWQILVILAIVLSELIRRTGESGPRERATRAFAGPATLAGPVQPWQIGDLKHG